VRGRERAQFACWASIVLLLALALSQPAWSAPERDFGDRASDPDSPVGEGKTELRSQVLEEQRKAKLDVLLPPEQNILERGLLFFETSKFIDRLRYGYHGFFLQFGGLSTRSGFALGLRYQNDELIRNTSLYTSFSLSANKYQKYEAGLLARPTRRVPVALRLNVRYRNYREEEYYGLGPSSSKDKESNYRREEVDATVLVGAGPFGGLDVGVLGGYLRSRTGAGTGGDDKSVDRVFHTREIPGFSESIEFWTTGFTAALDYRDSRGNPRSGVALLMDHTLYENTAGDAYSFQATSAEFQGYLPFLHKHRVIALRAFASEAKGMRGGTVPFHLLPYVGGGDTIRGFEEYRFRDGKLLLGNLEYRFEAFIGLDVALFGDFGQVGDEWSNFKTSEFKYSYGGGLRFNTAYSVFMRLDLGYGKEGTRFFWKFENVF
jgi:hypothetical protein